MRKDARDLQSWLAAGTGTLGRVLSKSNELSRFTQILRDFLSEPWADAVSVANLRDDVIVLYCANASAQTLLRYRQTELLSFVRQRIQPACTRIELRVAAI